MKGFLDLGNGMTAFIDGPDECQHKWNGPSIMYSSKGLRITPYTYMKWVSYTSSYRDGLVYQHHEDIFDPIVMCTSSCSKCGADYGPIQHMEGFHEF